MYIAEFCFFFLFLAIYCLWGVAGKMSATLFDIVIPVIMQVLNRYATLKLKKQGVRLKKENEVTKPFHRKKYFTKKRSIASVHIV